MVENHVLKGLKAVDKSAAFSIICLTALSGHSFATRTTNKNVAKSIEKLLIEDEGDGDGGGEGYGSETGDQGEATVCSSGTEVNEWEQGSLHYVETCKIPKKFNTETQECEVDPDGSPFGCILTVTPVDEDPNAPTGGTPGGTPGSPGGPGSSNTPAPDPKDPCNPASKTAGTGAATLLNQPALATKIQDFKDNAHAWTSSEHGFKIGHNSTSTAPLDYFAGTIEIGTASAVNNTPPLPANYVVNAFMHSHSNGSGPSAFDLYNLNKGYANGNTAFTTSYVINTAGEIYAMVVIDRTLFNAFAALYLKDSDVNLTDGDFSSSSVLQTDYSNMRQSIVNNMSHSLSNDSYGDACAAALGQTILDKNGGVSMYKLDKTTGKFNAIGAEIVPNASNAGGFETITKTKKCQD